MADEQQYTDSQEEPHIRISKDNLKAICQEDGKLDITDATGTALHIEFDDSVKQLFEPQPVQQNLAADIDQNERITNEQDDDGLKSILDKAFEKSDDRLLKGIEKILKEIQ